MKKLNVLKSLLLASFTVVALALAACGPAEGDPGAAPEGDPAAPPADDPLAPEEPADDPLGYIDLNNLA